MKKHPIIFGTCILALANVSTRIIGFFFRIYLSRTFGATQIGIMGLTTPVSAIVGALTCAGIQTGISKCVAEVAVKKSNQKHLYLCYGLLLSLSISCICSIVVYTFCDTIAVYFLSEIRTSPLLRVLSLTYIPSALHACLNGYFMGQKRSKIPALSQFVEQSVRVLAVITMCQSYIYNGLEPPLVLTAWGLLIGEIGAIILSLIGFHSKSSVKQTAKHLVEHPSNQPTPPLKNLLSMSIPLTANRLVLNFLLSIEAIRIPLMLQVYGLSSDDSLTIYGILTGIALPVILFPSSLTGALSAMLLPTISEANSNGDREKIKTVTVNASFLMLFMGVFFGLIFFMFSDLIGTHIFGEPLAASYIKTLCLLCPFMYMNVIFSGILQGLGQVMDVFFINTSSLFIRLCFIFFAIPILGIQGYFIGVLISQLYSSVLLIRKCITTNLLA
ncbi:MAG: oligosaccharide flippase family protein [Lachnospiraceae bacterium]